MGGGTGDRTMESNRAGGSSPGYVQGGLSRERAQALPLNHEKDWKGLETFNVAAFVLGAARTE